MQWSRLANAIKPSLLIVPRTTAGTPESASGGAIMRIGLTRCRNSAQPAESKISGTTAATRGSASNMAAIQGSRLATVSKPSRLIVPQATAAMPASASGRVTMRVGLTRGCDSEQPADSFPESRIHMGVGGGVIVG